MVDFAVIPNKFIFPLPDVAVVKSFAVPVNVKEPLPEIDRDNESYAVFTLPMILPLPMIEALSSSVNASCRYKCPLPETFTWVTSAGVMMVTLAFELMRDEKGLV